MVIRVDINRDSLGMADDANDHRRSLEFPDGVNLQQILDSICNGQFLAYASRTCWICSSPQPLATISLDEMERWRVRFVWGTALFPEDTTGHSLQHLLTVGNRIRMHFFACRESELATTTAAIKLVTPYVMSAMDCA